MQIFVFLDEVEKKIIQMKINFEDKIIGGFNYEFLRGICTQDMGAAELGE